MNTNATNLIRRHASIAALSFSAAALLASRAFCRADTIYVANWSNNTIGEFTAGGIGSIFTSTGVNMPAGLAFDSAGNLYAANAGDNTIEKFTTAGVGSLFATISLRAPTDLAF